MLRFLIELYRCVIPGQKLKIPDKARIKSMVQTKPTVAVIIAAAGNSARMGAGVDKQFVLLDGKPVLRHTLTIFNALPDVRQILVTVSPNNQAKVAELLQETVKHIPWRIVPGGVERQHSVLNALRQTDETIDIILVHDGARPFVEKETIVQSIDAANRFGAAVVAVPSKDTVKEADSDGCVVKTLDRSVLWQIQTPQAFRRELLVRAHEKAAACGMLATDDAALIEWTGGKVKIVRGSYYNFKVTTPEDLPLAEAVAAKRRGGGMQRVGIGYDVHRFIAGRPLMLGGVEVPYEKGLDGHSDADVLVHAIADALLGAAGLGDIGRHFPDTDPQYRGISSLILLAAVREKLSAAGYAVQNVDAVVQAETPKLAPFIGEMNEKIAGILDVAVDRVNVKATTTEKLGFVGRKEGIAAEAVAMVGAK